MNVKEECKKCIRYIESCNGTEYFQQESHYYCIIDWERFKNGGQGTRFRGAVEKQEVSGEYEQT